MAAICEPTVERSTKRLTRLPSITPPVPVATSSEACSDGRLASTVSQRSAMSLGDDAALRAHRDELVDGFLPRVEYGELVPGLDQAARHREAHLPEADESDFHGVISLYFVIASEAKQSILSLRGEVDCFASPQ